MTNEMRGSATAEPTKKQTHRQMTNETDQPMHWPKDRQWPKDRHGDWGIDEWSEQPTKRLKDQLTGQPKHQLNSHQYRLTKKPTTWGTVQPRDQLRDQPTDKESTKPTKGQTNWCTDYQQSNQPTNRLRDQSTEGRTNRWADQPMYTEGMTPTYQGLTIGLNYQWTDKNVQFD